MFMTVNESRKTSWEEGRLVGINRVLGDVGKLLFAKRDYDLAASRIK